MRLAPLATHTFGWSLTFILCMTLPAPGCGDDDPHDHPDGPGDANEPPEGYEPLVIGFTRAGETYSAELVNLSPAPPLKGDNLWTIVLRNGNAPLPGAQLSVLPTMPAHSDHGSLRETVVTETDEPGHYEIDINLFMAGIWRVPFHVCPAETSLCNRAAAVDTIVLEVWIEE